MGNLKATIQFFFAKLSYAKSQTQIVIQNPGFRLVDASCEDKENDTKEVYI